MPASTLHHVPSDQLPPAPAGPRRRRTPMLAVAALMVVATGVRAAVDAAVQDGKARADAQYLTTWVRNESHRLRTLPYAGDVRINLLGSCEEPPSQEVLLARLAKNASLHDVYYYTLTVDHGTVQQ